MHSAIWHSFTSRILPWLLSCVIPVNTSTDWKAGLRCSDCKPLEIIALLRDTSLNGVWEKGTAKTTLTIPSIHFFCDAASPQYCLSLVLMYCLRRTGKADKQEAVYLSSLPKHVQCALKHIDVGHTSSTGSSTIWIKALLQKDTRLYGSKIFVGFFFRLFWC